MLYGALTHFLIVVGFAVLMDRVYIQVEERMLEDKFGADFKVYWRRVRRWL